MEAKKQNLNLHLVSPRGFCAGVERAIDIVNSTIDKFGAPVYVRHQIVHNSHVVKTLQKRGAIFVKHLHEADKTRPIIFSAHGVPLGVPQKAKKMNMHYIDATCPLVSKVHMEAARLEAKNYYIILIGHSGHPEVIGTMGQVNKDNITLLETENCALNFVRPSKGSLTKKLAYITQTTLSLSDTQNIVNILQKRFPDIEGPNKADICYATSNRQLAVIQAAPLCDYFLVVGDTSSSNSKRLVEVAKRAGCTKASLISNYLEINLQDLDKVKSLGLTAGASAPENLVQNVIDLLHNHFSIKVIHSSDIKENVHFKMPPLDLHMPKNFTNKL